jgi:hypothetical protein
MTDLFTNSLLVAQVIGFVAMGFALFVFQVNKRKTMLKLQTVAASLFTVHFYMIGAPTGAALNFIGIARNYSFYRFKSRSWLIPTAFIAAFILVGVLTWQGPLSLMPMIAMTTGTIAFWQSGTAAIRLLALVAPPLWFTYNYLSGSYAGMITEVVYLSSNLIGIYRFDVKAKRLNIFSKNV